MDGSLGFFQVLIVMKMFTAADGDGGMVELARRDKDIHLQIVCLKKYIYASKPIIPLPAAAKRLAPVVVVNLTEQARVPRM